MNGIIPTLSVPILIAALVMTAGCLGMLPGTAKTPLKVFHAGSLSKPFDDIEKAFETEHPDVDVQREAAGSVETVKKVSELNQSADVVATADWGAIDAYLYGNFTAWYAAFATNSMVIMYTTTSKHANEITTDNWYRIVTSPDVQVGRSNPDIDPNGYRTLMVWKLAEKYYNEQGLSERLLARAPERFMREEEVGLSGALSSGQIDYAWNYKSVAIQQGFRYVELAPQVNLADPRYERFYETVNVTSSGRQVNGSVIEYGITIPKNAEHPDLAAQFVEFVFGPNGSKIIEANGQTMITPVQTKGNIPEWLKQFGGGSRSLSYFPLDYSHFYEQ